MLRRPTIAVEAASGDATTFRWPRFLVLVAALEDNVSPVRAAVRDDARLELLGAVAHAAACVARAVASLPDLIVIDADLPGGALAATSEIRARLPITHAVIMHAGAEDDDAFVEAIAAGASAYVHRDAEPDVLAEALVAAGDRRSSLSDRQVAKLMDAVRDSARPRRRLVNQPQLTAREWQVYELMHDLSPREIAERLAVSPVTVRSHARSIRTKLGTELGLPEER